MQTAIEFLRQHIAVCVNEQGEEVLRWNNREGLPCEVPLSYVVERFGPTIEQVLANGGSIAQAVATGDFDDGWKDIFAWWDEQGLLG